MKRYAPYLACLLGVAVLWLLLPRFNSAQPAGIRLTRAQARVIADTEARGAGIPVDRAWSILTWSGSAPLDEQLDKNPALRRRASSDPVIGPRLGGYHATYFRRGLEKFTPYGDVVVSAQSGEILMRRQRMRAEEPGGALEESDVRSRAETFVRSRNFPGAPSPQFEDLRPNRLRNRTDWIARFRVPSQFPTGSVVPYLYVYFTGQSLAGWALIEEYSDGRTFRGDTTSEFAGVFLRYGVVYTILLILLIIFLKKYHAGEVGISAGSLLFGAVAFLSLLLNLLIASSASEGMGMGGMDAQTTAWAAAGFRFLFFDLPLAVLVFFGWAVGESYARERWGERLASADAILRRDFFNATVGRSVLVGILTAPAVAAAAFLIGWIPLALDVAHPSFGAGTTLIVVMGGAQAALFSSIIDATLFSAVGILFMLALASKKRLLPLGVFCAIAFGAVMGVGELPIEPLGERMMFGFGAIAACIAVFLAWDLLSSAVALFGGSLLVASLPVLMVAREVAYVKLLGFIAVPPLLLIALAVAALLTRREVIYSYEDLAPHVKRIVERERVKAEIDAANRIQAALLPLEAPQLVGATVASHYRAATEIGGDYFDFLPQPTGEIGIAFGDVSGHGLTSGIVMAMAKSALLVQVDYDASPRAVMNVLNDIVIRTAPSRIMMTFFFGLLDPRSQVLRFSSAGHLDPYVYRASPRRIEALSSWGYPLGIKRREPFREHTVDFSPGDRLILYSDGLIEAVDDDGEPFGFERFERALLECGHLGADQIKKSLLSSVRKFTRNRPPEDDQTLVVVSFHEVIGDVLARPRVSEELIEAVN